MIEVWGGEVRGLSEMQGLLRARSDGQGCALFSYTEFGSRFSLSTGSNKVSAAEASHEAASRAAAADRAVKKPVTYPSVCCWACCSASTNSSSDSTCTQATSCALRAYCLLHSGMLPALIQALQHAAKIRTQARDAERRCSIRS